AYKVSHIRKVVFELEEPNEEQGQEESQEAWMNRLSKKYGENPSRHREEREELEMSDSDSEHLSRYGQEDSENEDDEQDDWYL
uniref:Uncharacterized protein n=2 Tax=Triticinae TaxID=1648030 RepID=A0A452ZVK0_AEGTS